MVVRSQTLWKSSHIRWDGYYTHTGVLVKGTIRGWPNEANIRSCIMLIVEEIPTIISGMIISNYIVVIKFWCKIGRVTL